MDPQANDAGEPGLRGASRALQLRWLTIAAVAVAAISLGAWLVRRASSGEPGGHFPPDCATAEDADDRGSCDASLRERRTRRCAHRRECRPCDARVHAIRASSKSLPAPAIASPPARDRRAVRRVRANIAEPELAAVDSERSRSGGG
jgi:hypothetical protein